jgi:hypothetical protein
MGCSSSLFGHLKTVNVKNIHQCEFPHGFLTGLVAGTFLKKSFFDLTLIKTNIPVDHEWINSSYHEDLENPLAHHLDNEESPTTLYFSFEDERLQLDLMPKTQKTRQRPTPHTVDLNVGDFLFFIHAEQDTGLQGQQIPPVLHTGSTLL